MSDCYDYRVEIPREIYFVALGWLFGLVSALVLEANRRARLVRSLRRGLLFELSEAELQIATIIFSVARKLGTADRELLEWTLGIHERYRGSQDVASDIIKLRSLRDDPRALSSTFSKKWSILKHYPTPALDAAVTAIADFSGTEQVALLELRSLFASYNSAVDQSAEFLRLTFDATTESHSAAIGNLTRTHEHLTVIGRKISERAGQYVRRTA